MKRRTCLIVMNVFYYAALAVLVVMLILPHTSMVYRIGVFESYGERVNSKTVYLRKGERYQIRFFGIRDTVKFQSSDFKVACVNQVGIVTARKPGKTFVEMKSQKGACRYRVYVIALNKKKLKMHTPTYKKLSVKGYSGRICWKSSNPKVVSVNRFGWIHSKKKGTATITAEVKGRKLTCKVKAV